MSFSACNTPALPRIRVSASLRPSPWCMASQSHILDKQCDSLPRSFTNPLMYLCPPRSVWNTPALALWATTRISRRRPSARLPLPQVFRPKILELAGECSSTIEMEAPALWGSAGWVLMRLRRSPSLLASAFGLAPNLQAETGLGLLIQFRLPFCRLLSRQAARHSATKAGGSAARWRVWPNFGSSMIRAVWLYENLIHKRDS